MKQTVLIIHQNKNLLCGKGRFHNRMLKNTG
nr:MAG TPA: hypothetical protein [Caudoviricetes sp.]